ncbi:MAG: DUF167 domain-containing protein [Candidatus Paceibacterota bacterium]|jgi:uncharacterized protein YggU (UPF0235/DUF167 family)
MYIKVRVVTYAKEEKIEVLASDSFRISVKEKPEQGQANERVIELIRAYYGGKVKGIRIEKGHHSPYKILFVNF